MGNQLKFIWNGPHCPFYNQQPFLKKRRILKIGNILVGRQKQIDPLFPRWNFSNNALCLKNKITEAVVYKYFLHFLCLWWNVAKKPKNWVLQIGEISFSIYETNLGQFGWKKFWPWTQNLLKVAAGDWSLFEHQEKYCAKILSENKQAWNFTPVLLVTNKCPA